MHGMVYCCSPCKPRYRRLVDSIYPTNARDGLNGANLNKLTFYASSHPEKLDRIGDYILQRLSRDLYRLRFNQVKVSVETMDSLLQCCHSSPSLPQLSEHHLKMIQKLLESNLPYMEQLGTDSFVKFSNIEESAPCYHRQYDFFISKFSQMCHSSNKEADKVRIAGLKGLRGVVWKSVTEDIHGNHANIWEKQHMDKIIPSFLFNLQEDEPKTLSLLEGPFGESGSKDETVNSLAGTCLRELMGKASFGTLRVVIEPVLRHLDLHKKWQPPPIFAIHVFRIILYSIQSKSSYYVIQELIDHLDTMSSSDASVRIGIASVLSSIVSIAGTSIGPLLLSIFNSLLKHLRASVEFQQSKKCPSTEDEKTYQETLINAMGDFANALPDYQKVEMMMFTVGNIPSLSDERKNREGDAFLQHVLVKTLLKVATRFRTSYLATIFTDSFLNTLQQLALVPDPQVRLITQKIFHTLLDRHDNVTSLQSLDLETDISDLQLTVEKCSSPDQMFMRKNAHSIMVSLYRATALMPEDADLKEHADAILCTMLLFCIEAGYDESIIELFRLCFGVQTLAMDQEQPFSVEKREAMHNIVARYLNVCSQLLAIPALYQHVHQVKTNRVKGSNEDLDEDVISTFDRNVVSEALKNSGKDVTQLSVPFLASRQSEASYLEQMDMIDGKAVEKFDAQSMDSSFEWTPPESTQISRRNTVFSLDGGSTNRVSHLQSLTGLPVTVHNLKEFANRPIDKLEEKRQEESYQKEVLQRFRSTGFEEISDEIARNNDETDIMRCISRILSKRTEKVRMKNEGRSQKPKNIFSMDMPAFVSVKPT
ncbi:unnamed protein product, partial [Mesorhabditis belari]|uniref:Uncharacterized protein n=1 Tax=Mesorhabditis belari TaxID=2138241 RepID=A0AAF3FJ42_9BILA